MEAILIKRFSGEMVKMYTPLIHDAIHRVKDDLERTITSTGSNVRAIDLLEWCSKAM
jgi:hypothetical protein